MDLQISLFLLFVLFTAGHSFSCYECSSSSGSCVTQDLNTCPSGVSQCLTSTTVAQVGSFVSKSQYKNCAVDCINGSFNMGTLKMSMSCCNTDQCNIKDPSDSSYVPNGNKCYSCDGKSCSNILSCSGSEDRCFQARAPDGQSAEVKGCMSKSVCDAESTVTFVKVSCCSGYLCNGVESVSQSFLFLCCSLLSFILLH